MIKNSPSFIQKIKTCIQESIDSTPERVSIFFKKSKGHYSEHDQFIGITVPTLRKIAKKFLFINFNDLSILLSSKINEERLLALIILVYKYQNGSSATQKKIYKFYLKKLQYINNWNLVDSSAYHILGHYLHDKDKSSLEIFAQSNVLWERRISVVTTLYFIRQNDICTTFKIAKLLFNDKHDLIHKAVGWMLREAGKKDEIKLISFLSQYKNQMPKIMLRYAIEKLTPEQKIKIIKL